MKPSRLQNVLKSFGRAPKCIKILWPDPKIHEILENVGSGLPKICKKKSENCAGIHRDFQEFRGFWSPAKGF